MTIIVQLTGSLINTDPELREMLTEVQQMQTSSCSTLKPSLPARHALIPCALSADVRYLCS